MDTIMYCINCGKKNEIQKPKLQTKCKKCGKFLTLPIIIEPLQKRTSQMIYKDTKGK